MKLISAHKCICLILALGMATKASPKGFLRLFEDGAFSAQVQADMQYCLKDSVNDEAAHTQKFLSHIFVDGNYNSRMLNAGLRFEMYENPLPGFEANYKGVGVPHFYLTLNLGKLQVTGGDFYEQFGSGLILRTYQERTLGIDNALRGGRVVYQPFSWLEMKALAGVQRNRWQWGKSSVAGGDITLHANEWFSKMEEWGQRLEIGGSFVSKHQQDELILSTPNRRLNLPLNVGAFSARMKYYVQNWMFQGEYAYKFNDPSSDNGFIYRPGQALILTGSYSRRGLGITVAAKHCDNMSYRSQRTARESILQINYLPAFTRQHTYTLAALYPYATQFDGEVAFQADVFYNIKKGSLLGGEYGMDVKFNYSQVFALDKKYDTSLGKSYKGTYGYKASLFAIGDEIYYRDVNVELSRKMNSNLKLSAMYMHQLYNQIIRGKDGLIRSHIAVAEAQYFITPKIAVRGEVQYLATRQDEKDWLAALLELSFAPHWMVTYSHQYNVKGDSGHYPLGSVAFSTGAHRIQLSGGKQREGYSCAGGVCRYVPATKGFAVSYTANF